jgi:hypothetical protein
MPKTIRVAKSRKGYYTKPCGNYSKASILPVKPGGFQFT